jgi:hypothetical protein
MLAVPGGAVQFAVNPVVLNPVAAVAVGAPETVVKVESAV